MMDAVERSAPGMVSYPVAARRLGALDSSIAGAERRLEELTHCVITARSRHDLLTRRAQEFKSLQARKRAEVETQELVQSMHRNGPRKGRMVD